MAPRALGYLLGQAVLEAVLELEHLSEAFAKVEEAEPKRKCFAACMKLLKVSAKSATVGFYFSPFSQITSLQGHSSLKP